MTGTVNAQLEATLRLKVHGPVEETEVTAVIDTGYNGSLSLPLVLIEALSLPCLAPRPVLMGDGSNKVQGFYRAAVAWEGVKLIVSVLCVEGEPVIGTALLKGWRIEADFVSGGQVRIVPLP